jgi:hypothetical protein
MRAIVFLTAAALLVSQSASAQGWKEYSYQEAGFAAQYPGEPKVEEHPFETANGTGVVERDYSVNSGGVDYIVSVADFTRVKPDEHKAIDEAANKLIALGRLTDDVSARIDWYYGREIRVVDRAGTSYTDAIFLIENKLYQLKVVFPATNSDPVGSSGIHFFQQAFRLLR